MKLSEEYEDRAEQRYEIIGDRGWKDAIFEVMDFERKFIRMAEQLEHIDLDEHPRWLHPVIHTILEEYAKLEEEFEEDFRECD